MRIDYSPPIRSEVDDVATRLRAIDILELANVQGLAPVAGLRAAIEASTEVFTVNVDGKAEGYLGFQVGDESLGAVVWMLGTDKLFEVPRELVEEGRRISDEWCKCFPLLHNFVAAENHKAIKWLEMCGFNVAPSIHPYGPADAPFRYFWKVRHV